MALFDRLRSWMQRRTARQADHRYREWRRQLYPDFCVTRLEQRRVFNAAPVISPQTFDVDSAAAIGQEIAKVQASDADVGDRLTFAITSGNTGGAFAIDENTGRLTVADNAALSLETEFELSVEVTDSTGLSNSATITVNVNPSGPGNARPTVNDQRFVIPRSSPNATFVGFVVATDANGTDTLTWSITSGNDSGAFMIDPTTGEITVADETQLTTAETRSLTVKVEDSDGAFDEATIQIQLNDAPTDASLSSDTVDENDAGAVVGTLSVTDANSDDQFTVTVSDSRFEVLGGQLKLKNGQALDHETAASVPVTITITDAGGETYEEQFTIFVTDVNEGPTGIDLSNATVDENDAGAVIGTVTVTDPDDPNEPFGTHMLIVQEDLGAGYVTSSRFEIVGGQLRLKAGQSLDHESEPTVGIRIVATDGGNLDFHDDFLITVTDVNEAPTDIALVGSTVAENAAGAAIGAVTVTDPDDPSEPFGTHTLVVQEDYGAGYVTSTRFEVVGGQLRLKAGQSLDHETEPTVSIRIIATDGGGIDYHEDFTITVTDVNEAPTDIMLGGAIVTENAVGAVIGTVTSSDPDDSSEPFGTHTLAVQEDYGAGYVTSTRFEIVGGQLRLKAGQSLNHEAEPTVSVRIVATDGGGLAYHEDFTITVTDINESPTDITLSNQSVAENSAGAVVGNVTVTDPDNPAEPFGTHSLVVQEDYGEGYVTSTRFEIVGGQLRLKAGESLDHETEASIDLRIVATDGGGLNYAKNVTISVTDMNEAPTSISLGNNTVAENSAGAVVGAITVADVDDPTEPFGTHTYLVQEDYGAGFVTSTRFEVSGGQLRLKAGVSLDHEAEASTEVLIRATDGGGAWIQQGFTITITDVNEVATNIALSNQSVSENLAGATIGTITVTDPDDPSEPFGMHSLAVEEDYGEGYVTSTRFEIVGNELKLKPGVSLNHEAEPTVTVRIRATDGGGLELASNVSITVEDVNEPPTDITLSNSSVAENLAGGVVGTVTVVDADDPSEPFGTHSVVVLEDYGGGFVPSTRFEIAGSTLRLKAGVELDHESEPTVTLRLVATDTPGLSVAKNFIITVTDVNDDPTATPNEYATTEDEAVSGNVITDDTGSGSDSDEDNDTLSVSAINGNAALVGESFTTASGATLQVNADGTFTFDPTTSADYQALETGALLSETFTYTVSDGKGGTSTATVTLHITGVNDAPEVASNANATGTEDTPRSFTHAQLLSLLGASDADDVGDNLEVLISDVKNATYAAGNSSGALYTFTPDPDFNGEVTFTYQVRDDELALSAVGTGTIAISAVNDAPVLSIDPLVVKEDAVTPLPMALINGYSDVETPASAATFTIVSTSAHISAVIDPTTQVLTITATTPNYNGPAEIVISVTDTGDGQTPPLSATQTVSVHVAQVNDPPTAVDDSQTVAEDGVVAGNVLANDFDIDSDPALNLSGDLNDVLPNGITADPSMVQNMDGTYRLAHGGTLKLNPNGNYIYQPAPDFFGVEKFLYRVYDSLGAFSVGTLTLHVTPVNDPPHFDSLPVFDVDPANPTGHLLVNVVPGPPNEAGQQVTFSYSYNVDGIIPPPTITPHPVLANTWVVQFSNVPFENRDVLLTLVATDDGAPVEQFQRTVLVRVIVSQVPVSTVVPVAPTVVEFPVFNVTPPYIPPPAVPTLPSTPLLIATASADSGTHSERVVEVYLVHPDGNTDELGVPTLVLPAEFLNDLKRLFRELPDDRYRIYLRMEDGTRKEVVDVYVRDGRPFDPGQTSEELVIPEIEPPAGDEAPADDTAGDVVVEGGAPQGDTTKPTGGAAEGAAPPEPAADEQGSNTRRDDAPAAPAVLTVGSGIALLSRAEKRRCVQRALNELARRRFPVLPG